MTECHSHEVLWTVQLNKAQDMRSSTLATMTRVVNQELNSFPFLKKGQATQIGKILFHPYVRTKTWSRDGGCYSGNFKHVQSTSSLYILHYLCRFNMFWPFQAAFCLKRNFRQFRL